MQIYGMETAATSKNWYFSVQESGSPNTIVGISAAFKMYQNWKLPYSSIFLVEITDISKKYKLKLARDDTTNYAAPGPL